jgi:hypothetical protein
MKRKKMVVPEIDPPFINQDGVPIITARWQRILEMVPEESNFLPSKLGELDGVQIFLVDGDSIRSDLCSDFAQGGHDLIYAFIPEQTIWLDATEDQGLWPFILYRQMVERSLMLQYGLDYETAHQIAEESEADEF